LSNSESATDPVFAEPWQARAFALTRKLVERELLTNQEWTSTLAQALRQAYEHGGTDDGSHYYEHWLTALETLAVEKGLTDAAALAARKEAWREAYHSTPHGQPVALLTPRSAATDNPNLQLETNDSRRPR
jgi:nitrile hydratase accessory protein